MNHKRHYSIFENLNLKQLQIVVTMDHVIS